MHTSENSEKKHDIINNSKISNKIHYFMIPDCCPGKNDAPPGGKTATAPAGGFFCTEGDSEMLGVGPNGSF